MIMYGIVLVFAFWAGGEITTYEYTVTYNITCLGTGEVQWFNESTEKVCGKQNPLHRTDNNTYDKYDINYLDSFNLT